MTKTFFDEEGVVRFTTAEIAVFQHFLFHMYLRARAAERESQKKVQEL